MEGLIMHQIPKEVLQAVKGKFSRGEQFKIRHHYKQDGTVCTPSHKDPAMTLTRSKGKWLFCCHRCGVGGYTLDGEMSPAQTVEKIKSKNTHEEHEYYAFISTPGDYVLFDSTAEIDYNIIPFSAYNWIWRYNIDTTTACQYRIGYSAKLDRVIIPIFEEGDKLVGWTGRCPDPTLSKSERQELRRWKYITKTQLGKRRYFRSRESSNDKKDSNVVILVEDIISAIKVRESTGVQTIALLTTSIGNDLVQELADKNVFVWLDPDVRQRAMDMAGRLRQCGTGRARAVVTLKDPKDHSAKEIESIISSRWFNKSLEQPEFEIERVD
jgi:hypothetical protein